MLHQSTGVCHWSVEHLLLIVQRLLCLVGQRARIIQTAHLADDGVTIPDQCDTASGSQV